MAEVQKWMPADGVGAGARVLITEVDPICALQACMEGYLDIITVEHKEACSGFDRRGRSHLCTAGMHGGLPQHLLVSGRQQILTTDSMPDLIQVNRALTQGSLPSLHEGFDRGSSGCSDGLRSADGSASQEANGSYMSESSDHPTGPLTPTERCCQMRHR